MLISSKIHNGLCDYFAMGSLIKRITWVGLAGISLLVACTPINEPDSKPTILPQPEVKEIILDTATAVPSAIPAPIDADNIDRTTQLTQEMQLIEHPLCLYSCPLGADATNFLVDHTLFFLSANRKTKFADWVAYQVKADNLSGGTHPRNWKQDPVIPTQFTLSPADYEGANAAFQYDRGHQAPLADFSNNPDWPKTNYLSNITPQKAQLNQGTFAALESKERTLASLEDIIYVITGTVYLTDMPALPNATRPHRVPSGYWKVIAVPEEDGHIRLASFFFEQSTPRGEDVCDHSISLHEIEHITTFKFFADYPFDETTSLLTDLGC